MDHRGTPVSRPQEPTGIGTSLRIQLAGVNDPALSSPSISAGLRCRPSLQRHLPDSGNCRFIRINSWVQPDPETFSSWCLHGIAVHNLVTVVKKSPGMTETLSGGEQETWMDLCFPASQYSHKRLWNRWTRGASRTAWSVNHWSTTQQQVQNHFRESKERLMALEKERKDTQWNYLLTTQVHHL